MPNSEFFTFSSQNESEIDILKSKLGNMQIQLNQLQSLSETTNDSVLTLKQENDTLISELRKQNHYNRMLKQRLEDERFFYQKEKEYFCRELSSKNSFKLQKSLSQGCCNPSYEKVCELTQQYESEVMNLKHKVKELEHQLEKKSEASYDLCNKFLRMKETRDQISNKYTKLQEEYLKVLEDTMLQLDETRKEVNFHADKRFEQPIHPTSAIFLQVLQRNSRLMHENSQLRLENQKLKFVPRKQHRGHKNNTRNLNTQVNKFHSSINLKQSSSRSSERLCILQRYKRNPTFYTNMSDAATTTVDFPKFHSIGAKHYKKQQEQLSDNEAEHTHSLSDSGNIPSRTVSAPEIIQTSNFHTEKQNNVNIITKECSTNT